MFRMEHFHQFGSFGSGYIDFHRTAKGIEYQVSGRTENGNGFLFGRFIGDKTPGTRAHHAAFKQ